jgi:hypothetical protein
MDETLQACRNLVGFGLEGWVPTECYEEVMTRSKQLKEVSLAKAKLHRLAYVLEVENDRTRQVSPVSVSQFSIA